MLVQRRRRWANIDPAMGNVVYLRGKGGFPPSDGMTDPQCLPSTHLLITSNLAQERS